MKTIYELAKDGASINELLNHMDKNYVEKYPIAAREWAEHLILEYSETESK